MNVKSFAESKETIKGILTRYTFDDLARSLFALSLWLPNIASPIKFLFLYNLLESIEIATLPKKNQIKNYKDFVAFSEAVMNSLPTFPAIEDYVPEPDWGEIKYYLNGSFYRIFYGSELSNQYDFYSTFEIIHRPFEEYYLKLTGRSPIRELEACVKFQHNVIQNIKHQPNSDDLQISPGFLSVPSREFWMNVNSYLTRFSPVSFFDASLTAIYARDFTTTKPIQEVEETVFINKASEGRCCEYFFLKKEKKYYPVLIRRFFPILYDMWGQILSDNYQNIQEKDKHPELRIGMELHKYIGNRIDESQLFVLVSAVRENHESCSVLFTTALQMDDVLYLIHVTPPSVSKDLLGKYLKDMAEGLRESLEVLSLPPTRLRLNRHHQIVEFRSKNENKTLEPRILLVIPYSSTSVIKFPIPKDLQGDIVSLDQIVGVIDEIEDLDELVSFFNHVAEPNTSATRSPLTSLLDMFGSYRGSYGVLVPGAIEPDFIVLDPHWGSNFRFESLSQFYKFYPATNFFGHPRSWIIDKEIEEQTGIVLKSKLFFGYAYYQKIRNTDFFINAPVNLMSFDQVRLTDLLMGALFDGLTIYKAILKKLGYVEISNRIQVILFPKSLVVESVELKHVRHLIPIGPQWEMDTTRLKSNEFGIRIVFDEEAIVPVLQDAKDRSFQIGLLISLLEHLNKVLKTKGFVSITRELKKDCSKRSRFRVFEIKKTASFPLDVRTIIPKPADFKIVDKEIAIIANGLGIEPGIYTLAEGQAKLKSLIQEVVTRINSEVLMYSLRDSISLLLEKIDALTGEYEIDKHQLQQSLDQDIDYEPSERSNSKHSEYISNHRNYRYLIEKFIQLQPKGTKEFKQHHLTFLLALVDKLLHFYAANDILWYDIYPTEIMIDDDYRVYVHHSEDMSAMQEEFGKELAQINLGLQGNLNDTVDMKLEFDQYLDEIDPAFFQDFGFGLRNLINVLQVLALWAEYDQSNEEKSYYSAGLEKIVEICIKNIISINEESIRNIIDFLTLKPEYLLKVEGQKAICDDLPVWEHRKRTTRYTLKPFVNIGELYYWGPHSAFRSAVTWLNISSMHQLPADYKAISVQIVLTKGHRVMEKALVTKTKEIIERYTSLVVIERELHKVDRGSNHPIELGDYDVLAFIKDKNVLAYIECKWMDPPYCLKDARRLRERIFGRTTLDGTFEKGYIQKAERRTEYLSSHLSDIMRALKWPLESTPPRLVALFVTQMSFWWTRFPIIETQMKFVNLKLLDDYISRL